MKQQYTVYDRKVAKAISKMAGMYYDDIQKVMKRYPGVSWHAMLLTFGHRIATAATNVAQKKRIDRKYSYKP